jgi:hypothetical protein
MKQKGIRFIASPAALASWVTLLALSTAAPPAPAQQNNPYPPGQVREAPPADYQGERSRGVGNRIRGAGEQVGGFVRKLFYGELRGPQPQQPAAQGRSLDSAPGVRMPPPSVPVYERPPAAPPPAQARQQPPAPAVKKPVPAPAQKPAVAATKPAATTRPSAASQQTQAVTTTKPAPPKPQDQPPAPTPPAEPPQPTLTPGPQLPDTPLPGPADTPPPSGGLSNPQVGSLDLEPTAAPQPQKEEAKTVAQTKTPEPEAPAPSAAAPSSGPQIPVGKRTGTPGRVISPFPPHQELDVAGMVSGSLALDPITNKVFQVP